MKALFTALIFAASLAAQTVPPATVDPADNYPSQTVGVGTAWNRGSNYPATMNTTIGVRIGSTKAYSWTDISTPIAKTPAGSQPLPSSITTGMAYIVAANANQSVSLLAIVQGGFSSISPGGGITPSISGSFGVAFRPWKAHVWIMPYVKAANPTMGTNGAVATAVMQPGVSVFFGFGGK